MNRSLLAILTLSALGAGLMAPLPLQGADEKTAPKAPAKEAAEPAKPGPAAPAAKGEGKGEPKGEAKGEAKAESKIAIEHDELGRVVIKLDAEARGKLGLELARPAIATAAPEARAYGHVLDPGPLAGLANDLASAQAAAAASAAEWARTKVLQGQGNTSARAAVLAEAAARHDELAVRALHDRLALAWGRELADRGDLTTFVQTLTGLEAAVVRIDLPGGERLHPAPAAARLVTLAGREVAAQLLGPALSVDPGLQGQGFLFLVPTNQPRLLPGEAVTGFLRLPGAAAAAVVPPAAVIRAEGSAWVFVAAEDKSAFTRTPVTLEHRLEKGWLVCPVGSLTNQVVVTGAQALLSQESKALLKPD